MKLKDGNFQMLFYKRFILSVLNQENSDILRLVDFINLFFYGMF
jgi:hypothetical protein